MTYLAVPYSHPDPKVREARFIAANRAAYRLMQRGDVVFSPISHSHPIEIESGIVGDHEFWAKQDDAFQGRCELVAVLTIDGWKESRGVQREIQISKEADIPIEYLDPKWAEPITEPKRKTAYELAAEITAGDRKKDYGGAFENHSRIAQIWSGILGRDGPTGQPVHDRTEARPRRQSPQAGQFNRCHRLRQNCRRRRTIRRVKNGQGKPCSQESCGMPVQNLEYDRKQKRHPSARKSRRVRTMTK